MVIFCRVSVSHRMMFSAPVANNGFAKKPEDEDLDVRFEDGVLTVRGQRKLEREDKREGYHRIERAYGVFARSFTLPATLDSEKVAAEQKNGVLRIFVPKRAEAKPKSISVKVN